jgi:hypothetical protein
MGQNKAKAQGLARKWWEKNQSGPSYSCDKCSTAIPRGEGYLCKPNILGMSIGGQMADLSGFPDLLCEKCFDTSPKARPFKEWWQFWK